MPEENHKKKAAPLADDDKPFLSEEDIKVLKENTLKLFNPADQNMFIHQCQLTRLHPLTGQIWARPEQEKMDRDGKYLKMLVITGIQGILSVADRSGVYDGSSPIEWCDKDGQWVDVWLPDAPPFAARATTWRKDHSRPEIAVVRWKAVANTNWDSPRNFWVKMPDHMIGKCALAASLRKLFPNLLSGVYESSEIMGGVPDMMEIPQSTLETDIEAQKVRITADAAAAERLKAQGVPTVPSVEQPKMPTLPRDPVKEVEPADDLDMSPASQRPIDWWKYLSCDPINNVAYKGKIIAELNPNLIKQAAEKWAPKVRAKWDQTTEIYRELAEGLELAWEEAQMVQAPAADTTAS